MIETEQLDAAGNLLSESKNYLYKDHLGSLDVITDAIGNIVQEQSFDAWGQRRNAVNWQNLSDAIKVAGFGVFSNGGAGPITTRGYTGHEMVDEVGIIHMNGRIYDPKLARFLQADPFVQSPTDTQMLNRYSYVRNNPLNATDPSGYFVFTAIAIALTAFEVATTFWAVVGVFAVAGFADALVAGASLADAFRAGIIAGASAAAFIEIGQAFKTYGLENTKGMEIAKGVKKITQAGKATLYKFGGNFLSSAQIAAQTALHGAVGGLSSVLSGGKFGHGFASAGITKGVMGGANFDYSNQDFNDVAGRTAVAAITGGTISELTGGKFANGASTAAMGHLLNQEGFNALRSFAENNPHKYVVVTGMNGEKTIQPRETVIDEKTLGVDIAKRAWHLKGNDKVCPLFCAPFASMMAASGFSAEDFNSGLNKANEVVGSTLDVMEKHPNVNVANFAKGLSRGLLPFKVGVGAVNFNDLYKACDDWCMHSNAERF